MSDTEFSIADAPEGALLAVTTLFRKPPDPVRGVYQDVASAELMRLLPHRMRNGSGAPELVALGPVLNADDSRVSVVALVRIPMQPGEYRVLVSLRRSKEGGWRALRMDLVTADTRP